jgi:predicted 3-demethylubiquinone-9 3-methyltransferase (glyoxalase superfamily)
MNNKIYPCLWFDGQAKAAAELYCSIFSNAKITVDTPMVVNFEIEGKKFMGLNGGPMFKINPSISILVTCESNEEIENAYNKLLDGGSVMMPLDKYPWSEKYAWVKDKFDMTWQLMLGDLSKGGEKIVPTFLFTGDKFGKAQEAIQLYTSLFPDSKAHEAQLYQEGEGQPVGTLKFGHFTLAKDLFAAMDGPGEHKFTFNEGVSLFVECDDQAEIDKYWNALTADGGKESQCGWLKDKFGVSWQIVPRVLGKLMSDPSKGQKVMQVVMKTIKFNIAELENA